LAKREHEQPSSSPRAAHLLALGALTDGPKEKNVTLKWRDANSLEHQASLPRHWRERNYALRVQRFGKGFVEIEIEAFTRTLVFELIGSARDTLRHARGIVLDLRNNGGGDASAMAEVASLFMPPATPLGQFTDRQGKVALALGTNAIYASALDRNRRPPLVILTSERTSSAAEILIAALQHSSNVAVIGGQTCGCVLAVRSTHALPDGGELEVSELDFRTAKGVRLEGLGITPDETVTLSRRDLYAHRDRIREVAVAKLHRSASFN
jgi:C-terminal processing protease CtpA/Prc